LNRYPGLDAGGRGANAKVNAFSETQMVVWLAIDIEAIRFLEHGRIAVGRAQHHMNRGTRLDPGAAHLDVCGGDAKNAMNRSIIAQRFLEGCGNQRRSLAQAAEQLRPARLLVDASADQVGRGADSGHHQHRYRAEELERVDLIAGLVGRQRHADQVFAPALTAASLD
jgi:hypothetical protein